MSLLAIDAVRRHVIPLWLGVMVAIVGGVGPFAGSAGFVAARRALHRPDAANAIRSKPVDGDKHDDGGSVMPADG